MGDLRLLEIRPANHRPLIWEFLMGDTMEDGVHSTDYFGVRWAWL